MNPTGLTIIISVILGLGLTVTGAYFSIDNVIQPQGFLFEGVVMFSLGIVTLLMVAIAASIGKTILTFNEILQRQLEIQQEMKKISNKAPGPGSFGSILSTMLQNPGANGITLDLSNMESPDLKSSLSGMMMNYPEGSLEGMGIDELEKELAKAVKTDDFERAEKIQKAIKEIKGSNDSDEKSEE
jgi:hypothetical protein